LSYKLFSLLLNFNNIKLIMNKLLSFLLLSIFIFSCSSDDENTEPTQDFTSFVFVQTIDNELTNCVAGYKNDGKYYKLGDLGTLKTKNQHSPEIRVNDNNITEIYFFTDYDNNSANRFDAVYSLKRNKKNIFELSSSTKGIPITDKTDPTQYPQ